MFSQSHIAMIGNAPIIDLSYVKKKIIEYPILIAVDGGLNYCHKMQLQPNLFIGDFESVDPHLLEAFKEVPTKRFPSDKDQTDLELALEMAFHSKIQEITIFGGLGGRTDHALGNIILLSRFPEKVFLESESERLFVIKNHAEFATSPGQIISLIPLNGPAKGVTTQGLKWALKDSVLDKHFIGISNEATGSMVSLSVDEGDLLCCINT